MKYFIVNLIEPSGPILISETYLLLGKSAFNKNLFGKTLGVQNYFQKGHNLIFK